MSCSESSKQPALFLSTFSFKLFVNLPGRFHVLRQVIAGFGRFCRQAADNSSIAVQ
jgi:hypothetical protein